MYIFWFLKHPKERRALVRLALTEKTSYRKECRGGDRGKLQWKITVLKRGSLKCLTGMLMSLTFILYAVGNH